VLNKNNLFEPFNQYFDKIYVLTLQRAIDRQTEIKLSLQGLSYDFFLGVDKTNLHIQTLEKERVYDEKLTRLNSRYNKLMTTGQIACAYSHVKIYEDIIKNNYSKSLILEDDVIVDFEKIDSFTKTIKELPENWDMFYLGYENKKIALFSAKVKQLIYHVQRSFGMLKWSHTQIANLISKNYSTHLKTAGYLDCTHAYCVTPKGAKILLSNQTPIAFTADNLLAHCCTNKSLNAFVSTSKIFNQDWQIGKLQSKSYLNT
jgi:glycosyl transferase, family 25